MITNKRKFAIKKKVVVATFLYTNYGGLLQGLALKTFLDKFDNLDVYNLNFFTKWHSKDSRVFNLYGTIKSRIGQILFSLIRLYPLSRRKIKTKSFKVKYFKLTRQYATVEDFIADPPIADVFVTGSDQVFNPKGIYRDVFYLNFRKDNLRKVSYAASFGGADFSEEEVNWIKPMVDDFDALSVREKSGSDFLTTKFNKKNEWVVDPVFLLTRKEWSGLAISAKSKSDYIFIYALAAEEELLFIANKIKKETGYQIICVRPNSRNFLDVDKVLYGCSPLEIIGLFENASYIVTDSFHGTAFSIIFDKPFNVFISRPEVSTRIFSLLELVDLHEKIITFETRLKFVYNEKNKNIDKSKLNLIISRSMNFIKKEIVD